MTVEAFEARFAVTKDLRWLLTWDSVGQCWMNEYGVPFPQDEVVVFPPDCSTPSAARQRIATMRLDRQATLPHPSRIEELFRDELEETLGATVKRDNANKTITFLDMLLAQTEEDQFNIGFQAESSTGKSYIPLELLEYFPDGEKRIYAGASPTSFYHEVGQYRPLSELAQELDLSGLFDANEIADPKRKVIVVDLRNRILIFLDQPHWQLLEKLRPLLSHDRKMLRYSITDKSGKGALRAKTVIILGPCVVIFCTTKSTQEDQERTRLVLLSPESGQEKIRESLTLQAAKISNRKAFRDWLESSPKRKRLRDRIRMIRTTGIREVIIPDVESILTRFVKERPHLAPRHQRDFPRLLYYVKAFALLNCFQRKRVDERTIEANYIDIEAGFKLYGEIAKSNELGVSPETYRIYEEVLLPLARLKPNDGTAKPDIVKQYLAKFGRSLGWKRLTTDILPALESAGLVRLDKNPDDLRETLVWCPIPGRIVEEQNNMPPNSAPPIETIGHPDSELVSQPIGPLDQHLEHTDKPSAAHLSLCKPNT